MEIHPTYHSEDGTLMVFCPDCDSYLPCTEFYVDQSRTSGYNRLCIRHSKLVTKKQSVARAMRMKMANEYLKDAESMEDLEAKIVAELEPLTEEAVNSAKIRKYPCGVCGSVRHLRPKYWSFRRPYDVDWRCPEHYDEPVVKYWRRGRRCVRGRE